MLTNKRLYLASSIDRVAESIFEDISPSPGDRRLVFISTAAEAEEGAKQWLKNDRDGLAKAGFDLFDYTITDKEESQIREDLRDVGIVHVNGGNTFYLLLQA